MAGADQAMAVGMGVSAKSKRRVMCLKEGCPGCEFTNLVLRVRVALSSALCLTLFAA